VWSEQIFPWGFFEAGMYTCLFILLKYGLDPEGMSKEVSLVAGFSLLFKSQL
jgi:hypothetical protein